MLIIQNADIRIFPSAIRRHPKNTKIQIGDLHANPVRFLYTLYKEGVITIKEASYQSIVKAYTQLYAHLIDLDIEQLQKNLEYAKEKNGAVNYKGDLPEEVLQKKALLQKSEHTEEALTQQILTEIQTIQLCPSAPFFEIIGDEVSDRGLKEDFMIGILKKLDTLKANFHIISSNHALWFIRWMQSGEVSFDAKYNMQGRSLLNFARNNKHTDLHIRDFFVNVYLKRLKLFTIEEIQSIKEGRRAINISTHAPVDFSEIQKIIKEFEHDSPEDTNSVDGLIAATRDINDDYTAMLEGNCLYAESIEKPCHDLYKIHWARPGSQNEPLLQTPKNLEFDIIFTHGHHKGAAFCEADVQQEISLDTSLGKFPDGCKNEDYSIGEYLVCCVTLKKESKKRYMPQYNNTVKKIKKEKIKEKSGPIFSEDFYNGCSLA